MGGGRGGRLRVDPGDTLLQHYKEGDTKNTWCLQILKSLSGDSICTCEEPVQEDARCKFLPAGMRVGVQHHGFTASGDVKSSGFDTG